MNNIGQNEKSSKARNNLLYNLTKVVVNAADKMEAAYSNFQF